MPNVGDVVEGTVKNSAKPGIFVDIGGEDGMIPHNEATRSLQRNDKVKVKVTEKRPGGKIRLSLVSIISSATRRSTPADETEPETGNENLDWSIMQGSFYSDSAREVLKEELFTRFAPKLAESCGKKLSTNALRNFYDAVKAIENPILQAGGRTKQREVFDRQRPFVKLLAAKVAHKSKDLPPTFTRFLQKGIEMSDTLEDFKGFVLVFEAVAGWHSKYAK
jgi:CRISPR type III-A-associated protein Csm2